jgi:hypothetical protein
MEVTNESNTITVQALCDGCRGGDARGSADDHVAVTGLRRRTQRGSVDAYSATAGFLQRVVSEGGSADSL